MGDGEDDEEDGVSDIEIFAGDDDQEDDEFEDEEEDD